MVKEKKLLQEELKEKIKEGVKSSDLKKKNNQTQFNQGLATPPDSPVLKPSQEDTSISPMSTSNSKGKKEQVKNLQQILQKQHEVIVSLNKKLELSEKTIKELKEKNKELNKTISTLQTQAKNPGKIKQQKETREIGTQTEDTRIFAIKNYSCDVCQTNHQERLPSQLLRVKGLGGEAGKKIWVCSTCRKNVIVIHDEEENWRDW